MIRVRNSKIQLIRVCENYYTGRRDVNLDTVSNDQKQAKHFEYEEREYCYGISDRDFYQ